MVAGLQHFVLLCAHTANVPRMWHVPALSNQISASCCSQLHYPALANTPRRLAHARGVPVDHRLLFVVLVCKAVPMIRASLSRHLPRPVLRPVPYHPAAPLQHSPALLPEEPLQPAPHRSWQVPLIPHLCQLNHPLPDLRSSRPTPRPPHSPPPQRLPLPEASQPTP